MLHLILHGVVFVQPFRQSPVCFQAKHIETVQLMENLYCSKVCGLTFGVGIEDGAIIMQSLLLLGGKRNNAGVGQPVPRSRVHIVWRALILGLVPIKTRRESCGVIS